MTTPLDVRFLSHAMTFLEERKVSEGLSDILINENTAIFESGLLDSLAFNALIAYLDKAEGVQIDMLQVDPASVDTLQGLIAQLAAAAE